MKRNKFVANDGLFSCITSVQGCQSILKKYFEFDPRF